MSYFRPRNLLLVLALFLATGLAVTITRNFRPEKKLEAIVKALPEGVELSLQDIDYTHLEDGRPRWRLVAEQVERQAASGLLVVRNPQLTFYAERDGREEGTLTAESGEVSDDYLKVRLRGDVVLKKADGYTLQAEQLDYDHDQQSVTSDAAVSLTSTGMKLQGRGLVYNLKQQRLTLASQVRGVFAEGQRK